jgi:hypothetical protein
LAQFLALRFPILSAKFSNFGSNVTPGDIDAVAFYDVYKIDHLQNVEGCFLRDIEFIKSNYLTDIRYARNDDEYKRSYWRGWYGFSRDEQPKGFVCLKLEMSV